MNSAVQPETRSPAPEIAAAVERMHRLWPTWQHTVTGPWWLDGVMAARIGGDLPQTKVLVDCACEWFNAGCSYIDCARPRLTQEPAPPALTVVKRLLAGEGRRVPVVLSETIPDRRGDYMRAVRRSGHWLPADADRVRFLADLTHPVEWRAARTSGYAPEQTAMYVLLGLGADGLPVCGLAQLHLSGGPNGHWYPRDWQA